MKPGSNLVSAIALVLFAPLASGQPASELERDRATCSAVAARANAQTLEKLKIPFALPNKKIEAFLRDRDEYGQLAKVDLNGDGKLENVVRVTQGTAHISYLAIYDAKWQPLYTEDGGSEQAWSLANSASDIDLIRYRGQVYILRSEGDRLVYLSRVAGTAEREVCQFRLKTMPAESLVESTNDRLCRLAQKRKLRYAKFSHWHLLDRDNVPHYDEPSENAAKIDIDNDGRVEFVVRLRGGYPGGRGCTAFSLGVLTPERGQLNERLTKLMPQGICGGTTSTPFTFEGEVYIEGKYPAERPVAYHQIQQLKNGKLKMICRFEVRLIHELAE